MLSTEIFEGNLPLGVGAFENNAFEEETTKWSLFCYFRTLKPLYEMAKLKIFFGAFPTITEFGSPGSAIGEEDINLLATCIGQQEIFLGPVRRVPGYQFLFRTPVLPADGVNCICWLETTNCEADSFHLNLFLNEIQPNPVP